MKKEEIIGGNYLAIGLGLGLVLGSAFSNIGIWVSIGGFYGIVMEWRNYKKSKEKDHK